MLCGRGGHTPGGARVFESSSHAQPPSPTFNYTPHQEIPHLPYCNFHPIHGRVSASPSNGEHLGLQLDMKKRILFVNSGAPDYEDIMALMAARSHEWELLFENCAANALAEMAVQPCDVVITELTLSDTTGEHFLGEVLAKYPETRTIAIADLEENPGLGLLGTTHLFVTKPLEAEALESVLERALDSQSWLPNEAARKLTSQMTKLPSAPHLYFRVMRELRGSDVSLEDIGALIAQDPPMSAKLLQLANSVHLGLVQQVVNPGEAVMHLGLKTTQSFLLLAHTCSFFEDIKDSGFSVEKLWQHSIRTGKYAQLICKAEKTEGPVREEAFTAGLLHDIGKLALAANHPVLFREIFRLMRTDKVSALEAELSIFGTTHSDIAACLLATWGLPWSLVTAVALHHRPMAGADQGFSALTAIHVANAIDHLGDLNASRIDTAYLEQLELKHRLGDWKVACSKTDPEEK